GRDLRSRLHTGRRAQACPARVLWTLARAGAIRIPQRIADARQEVLLCFELRAPIAPSEAVIDTVETRVRRARKRAVELAHSIRESTISNLQNEVKMIRHQCPSEDGPAVRGRHSLGGRQEE